VTRDSTFAIMQPASGTCPVCLAPLKWAEIGYLPHLDGTRTEIRRLVCRNNHRTVPAPGTTPSPERHPGR
jgi:hypothetical protein